jgi:predicted XRE-type DNA-binding protein
MVESGGGFTWKTEAVKESDETLKEVIQLLSETGNTQKKVADEVGISQSRVSQLRRKAIKDGYLDTKNRLTKNGTEFLAGE